jgi:hypothetical protein
MHILMILLAAGAILGAHSLRAPARAGWFGAGAAFLGGLAVAAVLIRMGADAFGIGRTTPLDAYANHAAAMARTDDAPLIVFSGASFSRNAVDEERLTEALRARGYPHRAVSLSLEAASLLERDASLRQLIAAMPHPPDVVFIEIAQVTDDRPTFIFGNSKFSTRAIDQFTPRATAWTATGLAGGGCGGIVDCVKEAGFLSVHALLNALNIGLVGQGEITASVPPAAAYDAAFTPRAEIAPEARAEQLSTLAPPAPRNGPDWAMSFRTLQHDWLTSAGVRRVAYYFPPVISPETRAYAAGLCLGELRRHACISPDDPRLLAQLDGNVWLDSEHLLDPGAEIYIDWLADEIAGSGVLEAAP